MNEVCFGCALNCKVWRGLYLGVIGLLELLNNLIRGLAYDLRIHFFISFFVHWTVKHGRGLACNLWCFCRTWKKVVWLWFYSSLSKQSGSPYHFHLTGLLPPHPPPIFVVVDHTAVFYQNEDDCRTRHYNLFLWQKQKSICRVNRLDLAVRCWAYTNRPISWLRV